MKKQSLLGKVLQFVTIGVVAAMSVAILLPHAGQFLEQMAQPARASRIEMQAAAPSAPAPYALLPLSAQSYKNVVVVAQSGGDYTSVAAALNSISDNSSTNGYLVYVAPGVYTETVYMKPYVDIEGAGENVTRITQVASASNSTVIGASNAELRFLTVEITGGTWYSSAINNGSASPSLLHVTASAFGSTIQNVGISNSGSSSPTMNNVTASASGSSATLNAGVFNISSSSPTMNNVTASASGSTANNYGVFNSSSSPVMNNVAATASGAGASLNAGIANVSSSPTMNNVTASASGSSTTLNAGVYNSGSSPTMNNVTATASDSTASNYGVYDTFSSSPIMNGVTATAFRGSTSYGVFNAISSSPRMSNVNASASGASDNIGIANANSSSPSMNNVTATASGGTNNFGVYNDRASATIENSVITGSGGNNAGIYNTATSGVYTVTVDLSKVTGSSKTIRSDAEFTTKVGGSKLEGGAVFPNGGTVTCAGVFDENYTIFPSTCP